MPPMTLIPIETARPGQVVRFVPRSGSRRATVLVSQPYAYGAIMGRRATVADGIASSRGNENAYFAQEGTLVEVVR